MKNIFAILVSGAVFSGCTSTISLPDAAGGPASSNAMESSQQPVQSVLTPDKTTRAVARRLARTSNAAERAMRRMEMNHEMGMHHGHEMDQGTSAPSKSPLPSESPTSSGHH